MTIKRYTPEEVKAKFPNDEVACYDCGKPYGEDGWVETILPTPIWKQIQPMDYEVSGAGAGGILCIHCMNKRLAEIGLQDVPIQIYSQQMKVACIPAFCEFKPIEDAFTMRETLRYQIGQLGWIMMHHADDHDRLIALLQELVDYGDNFLNEHNLLEV